MSIGQPGRMQQQNTLQVVGKRRCKVLLYSGVVRQVTAATIERHHAMTSCLHTHSLKSSWQPSHPGGGASSASLYTSVQCL